MAGFVVTCPRTGLLCTFGCIPTSDQKEKWCVDEETDRILSLSDEEVEAEHLAMFGGDKKLAEKSVSMTKATIERALAEHWKQ